MIIHVADLLHSCNTHRKWFLHLKECLKLAKDFILLYTSQLCLYVEVNRYHFFVRLKRKITQIILNCSNAARSLNKSK